VIETPRLSLHLLSPEHAPALLAYHERNREHLAPWEPIRPPEFFTLTYQKHAIAGVLRDIEAGRASPFIAFLRDDPERMIASINIFNIARATFCAAVLGYSVDASVQGRGIGSEGVAAVVDYAFTELRLHRIMANYNPINERSGRLLRKLGFVPEGYARDYLFIAGAWRDHILTAKLNPDPTFRPDS
jgi:ribosomal-protein-alanine N-acetyltransferase